MPLKPESFLFFFPIEMLKDFFFFLNNWDDAVESSGPDRVREFLKIKTVRPDNDWTGRGGFVRTPAM